MVSRWLRLLPSLKKRSIASPKVCLRISRMNSARYPPTPAMKRFADSLARQNGIKPPLGYKTSISICGVFLKQHAPKKSDGETVGKLEPKPASPAQLLYATKIAFAKGVVIPDKAK